MSQRAWQVLKVNGGGVRVRSGADITRLLSMSAFPQKRTNFKLRRLDESSAYGPAPCHRVTLDTD